MAVLVLRPAVARALAKSPDERWPSCRAFIQAVMAADTLLNAMANSGQVDRGAVARIRPNLDRAYAQVRDPNSYRPEAFRASLTRVAQAARSLK